MNRQHAPEQSNEVRQRAGGASMSGVPTALVRWFWIGDHGEVGHAFRGSALRAFCGRGPGWIEVPDDTPDDKFARCKGCLREMAR